MPALLVEGSWCLPLSEVSGLTLREHEGRVELLAVGDEAFVLARATIGDGGELGDVERVDLGGILPAEILSGDGGSEFEAVAVAPDDSVCILQEGPSRVLILSPGLDDLWGVISLRVDRKQKEFGREWADRPNARGEAMLHLAHGHLLVVKQRDPVAFIEFGPEREPPIGVVLPADDEKEWSERFAPGATVDYEVLASWGLAKKAKKQLESVNDLAWDNEGRLYVVSSLSRCIARLERHVGPQENNVSVEELWDLPDGLPGGDEAKAEGLVIGPRNSPFVSFDIRGEGDNVVRFSALARSD